MNLSELSDALTRGQLVDPATVNMSGLTQSGSYWNAKIRFSALATPRPLTRKDGSRVVPSQLMLSEMLYRVLPWALQQAGIDASLDQLRALNGGFRHQ